jgi:hypothetical protein
MLPNWDAIGPPCKTNGIKRILVEALATRLTFLRLVHFQLSNNQPSQIRAFLLVSCPVLTQSWNDFLIGVLYDLLAKGMLLVSF